ncbi:MAG: FAD-binding protein [Gemmatimonadota bacterium]
MQAWRSPAGEEELVAWLRARAPGERAPLITGATERAETVDAELRECGRDVVSTGGAEWREIVSYEPAELVVTVRAGLRIGELRRRLASEGQWLPQADAAPDASVGGWVSVARPTAWDPAFGRIRRQVLACRVAGFDGKLLRWGRAVVKNVAGYDVLSLLCGGHGRLGILTRVTLRVWPKPPVSRRFTLQGGRDMWGALWKLLDTAPEEWPRPDALGWDWRADQGTPRAWVRLVGSETSVDARLRRLFRWAESCSLQVAEMIGPVPARTDAAPTRSRSLSEVVLRISTPIRRLPEKVEAARRALGDTAVDLEAFPLAGMIRCTYRRSWSDAPADRRIAGLLEGLGEAAVAIERGGPVEHAAAEARRPDALRKLEARVAEALAGTARPWLADYL